MKCKRQINKSKKSSSYVYIPTWKYSKMGGGREGKCDYFNKEKKIKWKKRRERIAHKRVARANRIGTVAWSQTKHVTVPSFFLPMMMMIIIIIIIRMRVRRCECAYNYTIWGTRGDSRRQLYRASRDHVCVGLSTGRFAAALLFLIFQTQKVIIEFARRPPSSSLLATVCV